MKTALQSSLVAFVCLFISLNAFNQSKTELIRSYLIQHATELQINPADVSSIEIMSEAPSKAKGVAHVYVRQVTQGISITNGLATVTLKDGQVVHVSNRLIKNLDLTTTTPSLSAIQSVTQIANKLGLVIAEPLKYVSSDKSTNQYVIGKSSISTLDIPVKLVATYSENAGLQLAWDFSISTVSGNNWWSIRSNAQTGEIIEQHNWVQKCQFDNCSSVTAKHKHSMSLEAKKPALAPPPPGIDRYAVYAIPTESPIHGDRTVVINPSDQNYSPFGWHSTDGVFGDEYTIARGNNVYATEDIDDNNSPGYSPDGGSTTNFDFPYDVSAGVQGNLDAVITNLFYMNNMMHDVWAYYGFDEPSGNFQENNYSGTGQDSDGVNADAQDGSGTDNANFSTPPDGQNPRMQMYLWSSNEAPDPTPLTINSPSDLAATYVAFQSNFGPALPSVPLTQNIVLVNDGSANPTLACGTIINSAELNGKIALVRRGNCPFTQKVQACQDAGAVAVIVMNNTGSNPIAMTGTSSTITIPSVMIFQVDGNAFETSYLDGDSLNGTLIEHIDPPTGNDSDFDNGVIAHEYGHGISTRLTGGAANSGCLFNAEQMGEGWSDWFGLMLTIEPGDLGTDRRGIGTYLIDESTTGNGIRPAPYSTSPAINNYTYSATNNTVSISEPHGIGFVWATMLWDLNWRLIDEYGFDANVKTGTGGNNIAMALVIEGLKLQPCGPAFVDGRDAILEADELLYGGVNQCLIWEVFAKRGLGFSADQGDNDNRSDQTQAFDLPASCDPLGITDNTLDWVNIYPNPTKGLLNIDMNSSSKIEEINILDVQGKVVFTTNKIESKTITIDLTNFKSGIYFVQLTDVNGAKTVELVKH